MPLTASDQEFIAAWQRLKKASAVSKALGINIRNVYSRRRSMESKYGMALESITPIRGASDRSAAGRRANALAAERAAKYEGEMHDTLEDGVVLVASDCHYWPGIVTVAHEAFCRLAKALNPP
jgi:hypothetical protein